MISLKALTLSRGNKILLDKADCMLYQKQKIGLIGHNGCGKSSLFSLLLEKLQPDTGEYQAQGGLIISHLAQQMPDSQESALHFVLSGDEQYMAIQDKLKAAELEQDHAQVLACHEELTQSQGYSKPALAASIMDGLGFGVKDQTAAVNSFSGGWRMRLSLARCLMKPAQLYLLDEPTNHLDMEAIFWLERWLKQSPATLITISHDRDFLDAFVTHILHIHQQKTTVYTGNFSQFERIRAEQLALQQALFAQQQRKIEHMMSFVNRFKAKASKAKQAQGRLKAIARMELIAQAQIDSPFSFSFPQPNPVSNPLLKLDNASAGYNENNPILRKLNLVINNGDRVAFLGPNGQGKSTLIKTLVGNLSLLQGNLHKAAHLSVGYYAQHQLEELDCSLSPLETLQKLSPQAREQEIRDFLGGFDFRGDMASSGIAHFSGGEKARLALAKLIWLKPNLLLLDEPTNHLDLEMRSALEIALQSYEGALIIISHDRHLLRTTVDEFYLVYQQSLTPFTGDIDDYNEWLLQKQKTSQDTARINSTYKDKKPLQNRLKKLEQLLQDYQNKMLLLEDKLSDASLYEPVRQVDLNTLLEQRKQLHATLSATEEEWLEVIELLES